MSQRYFIQLQFKGTNYHGWQYQPNAITVQEVMEKAMSTVLREEFKLTGAGRTDTGVHASFFIAHFDAFNENLDNNKYIHKLNGFLPEDISIQRIWKVPENTHARFDAISRIYHYYINQKKDPFNIEFSCRYYHLLDIEEMNKGAKIIMEYDDFTSFSKSHTDVKTNNCRIFEAFWEKNNNQLIFKIRADRFLRNMVRAIVGTLIDLGSGKIELEDIRKIIEKKDRSAAGVSAPAEGLFLVNIEYPDEIFSGF